MAETLGGRAGDRNTEDLAADVLFGSGGGVDDDAFAGPGLPDQDGPALGAGDQLQRFALFAGEWCADPFADRRVSRARAPVRWCRVRRAGRAG